MSRRQARSVAPRVPSVGLRLLRSRQAWGIALGALSLLAAAALSSLLKGFLGMAAAGFLRSLFGWGAYPVVAIGLAAAVWLVGYRHFAGRLDINPTRIIGLELALLACLGLLHLPLSIDAGFASARAGQGGGLVGWTLIYLLSPLVGRLITGLILLCGAVAGAVVASGASRSLVADLRPKTLTPLRDRPAPLRPADEGEVPELSSPPTPQRPAARKPAAVPRPSPRPAAARPPQRLTRSARLPSLDLLAPSLSLADDDATARYQAQTIEETLAHFGVPAQVVDIQRGPTVTRFGVEPGFLERQYANGSVQRRKVRVSRIAALSSDLALALSAPAVRIEAPVPGLPLVGIEVPNSKTTLVNLRSVMETDAFRRIRSPLRVALGMDVSGQPVAADLASMPHLLIAGATGSGKSVCINALIACLLLENPPEQLQLVLIDPKRVELGSYNGVPHLVGPVLVDVDGVVRALRWVCQEMDRRYKLFAQHRVRHIEGYNAAVGRRRGQRMPYLAVFVDELADLMMVAPDEVERSICRVAQMGRATGIHLVVATQRPSVDVVTGLIKANFAARVAFAVSTQVDSRVILDAPGAEQLLGRGDMLFMSPDANRLQRLQGCFVSDEEIAAITAHWRASVDTDLDSTDPTPPWQNLPAADDDADPLLGQALELVGQQEQVSTSFLQRRLRIGYSRAARLMEELEERGVVGPDPGGGRSRQILAPDPNESHESTSEAEDRT